MKRGDDGIRDADDAPAGLGLRRTKEYFASWPVHVCSPDPRDARIRPCLGARPGTRRATAEGRRSRQFTGALAGAVV